MFEQDNANWKDEMNAVTNQYSNTKHSSPNITPIQASFKKNEGYVYTSLLEKRNKTKNKKRRST